MDEWKYYIDQNDFYINRCAYAGCYKEIHKDAIFCTKHEIIFPWVFMFEMLIMGFTLLRNLIFGKGANNGDDRSNN